MTNNCYVYALFDEFGAPFYIGKGSGDRWLHHERSPKPGRGRHKDGVIIRMRSLGIKEVPKVKIKDEMTHREALNFEIDLIRIIGRRPNGPLVNMTMGGDGLVDPSPSVRAAISAGNLGKKHGPCPQHVKDAISKANTGKVKTFETRSALSKALQGKVRSPEFKEKIRQTMKGRPANNKGKPVSQETRDKIKTAITGKVHSEASREKMKLSQQNRSPEYIEKIRAGALRQWERQKKENTSGRYWTHSEEQRLRMRDAVKKRDTPEYRAKLSLSIKNYYAKQKNLGIVVGRPHTVETKEKNRLATTYQWERQHSLGMYDNIRNKMRASSANIPTEVKTSRAAKAGKANAEKQRTAMTSKEISEKYRLMAVKRWCLPNK